MKVAAVIAEILKREGIDTLICYPGNAIIEASAQAGIRPLLVRQERIGLHMCDAIGRVTSGGRIGVFAMQHGPGSENAFGGVAQAFGESSPILVLAQGYRREIANRDPNFSSWLNFQRITKWSEQVNFPQHVVSAMRRAFAQLRSGRPRPVLLEIPSDLMGEEVPEPIDYTPPARLRSGPDPLAVANVAAALVAAEKPLIYAGQGVHYAKAWPQLRALAELVEAPVATSLAGKSTFPETHPLSLGAGSIAVSGQLYHTLQAADLVFGIGCSFSSTAFGIPMPKGKRIAHATLDPTDINKDVPAELALVSDAGLTLDAVLQEVRARLNNQPRGRLAAVTAEIAAHKHKWLGDWEAKRAQDTMPISPYRVLRDLWRTVDLDNVVITNDAGRPRDQLTPFWEATTPLSYIGWGKTTQLGAGLGYAMGAKLVHPEKLCINVWGDAAIGFTGTDFETAVREKLPILSILFNNSAMATEFHSMPVSTSRFRATDIGGDYAMMARSLGAYGEKITEPNEIIPAIKRGIAETEKGNPVLLEFITEQLYEYSKFG